MQGGCAYARAWVSHGVMVVLQWLPGHYTIGARRYMAGGHGGMMWVHLGEDVDVANEVDDISRSSAILNSACTT